MLRSLEFFPLSLGKFRTWFQHCRRYRQPTHWRWLKYFHHQNYHRRSSCPGWKIAVCLTLNVIMLQKTRTNTRNSVLGIILWVMHFDCLNICNQFSRYYELSLVLSDKITKLFCLGKTCICRIYIVFNFGKCLLQNCYFLEP